MLDRHSDLLLMHLEAVRAHDHQHEVKDGLRLNGTRSNFDPKRESNSEGDGLSMNPIPTALDYSPQSVPLADYFSSNHSTHPETALQVLVGRFPTGRWQPRNPASRDDAAYDVTVLCAEVHDCVLSWPLTTSLSNSEVEMMNALSWPKRHTYVLAASAALSSNCAFPDRPCSASSCPRRSCGLAAEVNVASGTAAPSRRMLT